MLPDLHTGFSRGRSGGLVFPSPSEFSTVLQVRFRQYVNHEFPDVQAGFRKGRRTRDQITNSCWIIEKARTFHKTSVSALLTLPKSLTVWIIINCGNSKTVKTIKWRIFNIYGFNKYNSQIHGKRINLVSTCFGSFFLDKHAHWVE